MERVAYAQLRENIQDPAETQGAAQSVRELALSSFRSEPLVPKSWAILALSADEGRERNAVLEPALKLNQREMSLQTAALSQAIEDESLSGAASAIDAILRVRPQRSQELFPLLLQAMAQPEAAGEFLQILDLTAPWQERFLLLAAGNAEARPTLALMHKRLGFDNVDFNRRLIGGLAGQGELTAAREIYQRVSAKEERVSTAGSAMSWTDTFPPFDWYLASSSDMRAEPSSSFNSVDVYVRSGHGGDVARKTLDRRDLSNSGRVSVRSSRSLRAGNLVLNLTCPGTQAPVLSQDLEEGLNQLAIEPQLIDCSDPTIVFRARAFRGEPDLRLTLSDFSIATSRSR
ncbi:hypothetical protein INR77_04645 [Erythrobacter sp. SCSIO 43205]|uniref:hypothetical protein n=1 Tax=Erythrobacter sp. SCSIO 43205 TaxID=2779361 RepID=UPI001CA88746|nr:hypothetical protein [Erythrobacter sp. SCSIO 43205]UAB78989.1 hypothetical protein INR77_04645 [Erythrobacter sp. SCSIO 43205]